MASSEMLRRVALVRNGFSEETIAYIQVRKQGLTTVRDPPR
jgi:hypothetical protein